MHEEVFAIKQIIIIKLGGSIVTEKHRVGVYIRRKLIHQIATEIADTLRSNPYLKIIVIHGAGSSGHQLANKYDLKNGIDGDPQKLLGSIKTRIACQKLNIEIVDIFEKVGLLPTSVHTASAIIQDDKKIAETSFSIIDQSLNLGCLPVMYGEMVFDKKLGMSVCSGDAIAMVLAKKYNAKKIIFASDIDGIYDKDPHLFSDATLIKNASVDTILNNQKISVDKSHNVDVTGGLKNKVIELTQNTPKTLKTVIICNGLKPGIITKALSDNEVGTVITL